MLAEYLNVTPNLQLHEIMSTPERLDTHLLEIMLSRHESGVAVLAAPNSFIEFEKFNAHSVTRLLDLVSASFEHIIIDLPRVWTAWSRDVLIGSDKVFVVGEMTVPGLRRARILADAIREQCGESFDVSVIMNKDRQRWFGNLLKRSDAARVMGARLAGFVSYQESAVREAIDRGLPLYRLSQSNKVDKDLSRIVLAK
jgi:pilus assembly protein CpaE